jgi:hypothetical protein
LQTLKNKQAVQLLDLSQAGARLELPSPEPFGSAVLYWLSFEAFGDLVWQKGRSVGLQFDTLLPLGCLVETRRLAPDVVALEELATRATAAAWASGNFDLGRGR